MKTSEKGREIIKEHEGFRSKAYPDPGSSNGLPWTIGYGHTRGVRRGMEISHAQGEAFLTEDLKVYEGAVNRLVKVTLSQNQFDALVSFVYNIGEGQFSHSTLLRVLNTGRYDLASQQFSRWNKNDGKVLNGLVRRRAMERALFDSTKAPSVIAFDKPKTQVASNFWLDLLKKIFSYLRSRF